MKKSLLFLFVCLALTVFSQDWEKVTDFMGLDSYCSDYLTVGTNDGIISFNRAYTEWTHLGMKGHKVTAYYPYLRDGDEDTLIAGTDLGIYYSSDYGQHWTKSDAPDIQCNKLYKKISYVT